MNALWGIFERQKVYTQWGGYIGFVADLYFPLIGIKIICWMSEFKAERSALHLPGKPGGMDFIITVVFIGMGMIIADPLHITMHCEEDEVAGGGVFVT